MKQPGRISIRLTLAALIVMIALALLAALIFMIAPAPPAPAQGQSFTATPGQQFYMDLDSRDGAFSEWRHLDISSMSAGVGELEIRRLGAHELFFPYFAIRVETDAEYAGLSLSAPPGQPPLVVKRTRCRKGKAPEETVVPDKVAVREKTPIRMFWSNDSFSLQVGSQPPQRFALSRPPKRLIISSSSGELKIHGLTLGRGDE